MFLNISCSDCNSGKHDKCANNFLLKKDFVNTTLGGIVTDCVLFQVKCNHTRWIHSSGVILLNNSSKKSETESKLNNNTEIKLDHMENLAHFRDNIKSKASEEQKSNSTTSSDLAGVDVHPDVLEARSMQEGGYRLPHPIWTDDEVSSVKITHRPPATVGDFFIVLNILLISKGGEHQSEHNEITSSQPTDTGEFNKD